MSLIEGRGLIQGFPETPQTTVQHGTMGFKGGAEGSRTEQ